MKVGDLVMFRRCPIEGEFGIITMATECSYVSKENSALRLYWVVSNWGVECFTGNQLVLV